MCCVVQGEGQGQRQGHVPGHLYNDVTETAHGSSNDVTRTQRSTADSDAVVNSNGQWPGLISSYVLNLCKYTCMHNSIVLT